MKKEKRLNLRKMTEIGILGAVSIVLGLSPLGFIPIGPTRATIMHVPVIIGALMSGPLVGAFVGLIFGLFSIFQAISNPTPTSPFFYNPLVSILPRIAIGLVTAYSYKLIVKLGRDKERARKRGLVFSSLLGSLTNTVGVLSMIYILYGEKFVLSMGLNPNHARGVILGIGLTNGIPEAIIASIISTAVVRILKARGRS